MNATFLQKIGLFLLGLGFISTGFGQSQIHLYLSPGTSGINHRNFEDNRDIRSSRGLGLQLGASYSFLLSESLAIGAGLEWGSFSTDLSFNGPVMSEIGTNSGYEFQKEGTNTADPTGFRLQEDANIVRQQVSTGAVSVVIPIFYRISELGNGGSFFLNFGPKVTIPLGDGSNWTGEGSSTYSGDFSAYFADKVAAGDSFTLVLKDLDAYGFSSDQNLTKGNDERPLFGSTTNIGFFAAPGISFPLGNNRTQLTIEAILQGGLTNLKGSEVATNAFEGRREGTTSLPNLSGEASNIGLNYGGVRVGVMLIGERSERPPKPDPVPKPDPNRVVKATALNVLYRQAPDTRRSRNQQQNDPEFDRIMETEAQNLRFKGTVEGEMIEDGQITYDANRPQKIQSSFNKENKYLILDDATVDENRGQVRLTISPRNSTIRQKIAVFPVDEKGKPINGFSAAVSFEGQTRGEQKMNSGALLSDLYLHPEVEYQVTITHPCYETTTQTIDFFANYQLGLRFEMESSGELAQVTVPVRQNAALGRNQTFNGVLNLKGERSEVNGTVTGNELILTGGCGLEIAGPSMLTLKKERGMDVLIQGQASDWKNPQVRIPMQGTRSIQPVEFVRLPAFHLMYVDISEAQDRIVVINELEKLIKNVKAEQNEMLGYLSNGGSPRTITSPDNMDDLLEGVSYLNPQLPIAREDLTNLQERIDGETVIPARKEIVLNFVLSKTIYLRSRNILIAELLESLGDDTEEVIIRIYTEEPIAPSERMKLDLNNDIEYLQLK